MEDVALVNKARRALANSYVFAYYAFDSASSLSGTKLTLFQDKQQQLEQEVRPERRDTRGERVKDYYHTVVYFPTVRPR
eukprot:evm.model.NODE_9949_length_46820_cov_28.931910.6